MTPLFTSSAQRHFAKFIISGGAVAPDTIPFSPPAAPTA
jgi:hypothetical protein